MEALELKQLCHKKNTFLLQHYLILYTPKQIYAFQEKLELVFVKHYAPNICLSPNMAEFAVVIPQKILDFA